MDPALPHRTHAGLRAVGLLTVLVGWLLPAALLLTGSPAGPWSLTLVLALVAAAASNIHFELQSGTALSPVGAPIVFAIVACSPPQAMLIAIVAFSAYVSVLRTRGPLPNLISAGLASLTVGATAWFMHAVGVDFSSTPGAALVSGVLATTTYLALDAIVYMCWDHAEAQGGRAVWEYFLRAAPLDMAVTGTAVMLAAPFVRSPMMVGVVLSGYTIAVIAVYRVTVSERRHRSQSERLRDMFSRYVPASVVGQLADSEDEVKLGGETRDISVLFCDIRGFTAWSELHTAEVVVQELNQLLGALTDAVMSCEGTLDKFTGDGLMAFWGAPLEQPDHAHRACRAAERIHDALAACNDLRVAEGMPAFEIGVGVATGPAVVGNIGHEMRLDYTAIGDTVNLAARLEAATKELGCGTVISQSTAALLGNRASFGFRALPDIRVKGKMHPVQVFGRSVDAGEQQAQAAA